MPGPIPISEGNNLYEDEDLEDFHKLEAEAIADPTRYTDTGTHGFIKNPLTKEEREAIKRTFLTYLAKGASVTKAVQLINNQLPGTYHTTNDGKVSRKQVYVWRKFDKEFAKLWDEAFSMGIDFLEDKAQDYAFEGNAALIQFLLRIRNPQRYAMNRHEVSGPGGGAIPVTEITRTIVDPVKNSDDPDDPDNM